MNISVIILAGYDEPKQVPDAHQVLIIKNKKGRGYGIVEGLKKVTGDAVIVLHADTMLPKEWQQEVHTVLQDHVAGGFTLTYSRKTIWTKLSVLLMTIKFSLHKELLGDRAQFARIEDWRAIQNKINVALMEDVIFCKEMKKRGTIGVSKKNIVTSARRFISPWKYTWKVLSIRTLYFFGTSPQYLYRLYYKKRP
jgi:hypothetical protein